jgi:uncharacterized protein (TIGR02001 family)
MKNIKILAAIGLFAAAGAAQADISSTVTLTNDYDFRGNSQSATDPALQASIDYADDSGWYVGGWASNVDFGEDDPDFEVDLYGGYTFGSEDSVLYDVGLVYYAYPGESDLNFFEAYAGATIDMFDAKLWYSNDFGGDDTEGSTAAWYLEANGTIPMPVENLALLLHAGYSLGDYWDEAGDELLDYSIGVGYTVSNFELALKYVDTSGDADVEVTDDVFNNEGRLIFTVSTTFPWGAE